MQKTNINEEETERKARNQQHRKLYHIHVWGKAKYDEKRREAHYSENDLVLVYKPFRKIDKSEKLLYRWLGPHKVIRRTSDLNYEVRKLKNKTNTTDVIHVTNLKPFNPSAEFQLNTQPRRNNHIQEAYPKNNKKVLCSQKNRDKIFKDNL